MTMKTNLSSRHCVCPSQHVGLHRMVVSALLVVLFFLTLSNGSSSSVDVTNEDEDSSSYSFDVSWSIKSKNLSSLLGDKQKLYDDYISGCIKKVSETRGPAVAKNSPECHLGENDRIYQAQFQPMSMRNYTEVGYTKIRAPEKVFNKIVDYWNKHNKENVTEWHRINSYHNMWESPPSIINLQNKSLEGGGGELMAEIWDSARDLLEEWTGQSLVGCSLWGIRMYHDGSILAPHVDRLPLVSSAIINIAQDVDEPWPLEVYGRDGKAVNITMEPGDMVLYESHSVVHGRPFPMKGNYFANVFIHFEPIGPFVPEGDKFSKDMLSDQERESVNDGLPPYILKGSPWVKKYKKEHPNGWKLTNTPMHAAARGDLPTLRSHLWLNPEIIHEKDSNGWQPIHEAARHGNTVILKLLVENGASPTERANFGEGSTPLELCVNEFGGDHPACEYLMEVVSVQKTTENPSSDEL